MNPILDLDQIAPTPFVPPWLARALGEVGTLEIPGAGSNERIELYHSATNGGESPDDVAWCSSLQCWCFECEGIESTRSKTARSWLSWGMPLDRPVLGCVTVLWRGSPDGWRGHVGLYVGESNRGIHLLGGNQANQVSVQLYPRRRLLAHRWPAGYPLPGPAAR